MKTHSAVLAALVLLFVGCGDSEEASGGPITSVSGRTMGTVYHVRLGVPLAREKAEELHVSIADRLEEIEASMSTYRADSEISRFNGSRSSEWFPVSREFAQVVAGAQEISGLTGGAFDITVAPLVELWGFGPSSEGSAQRRPDSLPSPQEIDTARSATGFEHLEVRLDSPGLRKGARPGLQIDLSGIAKGFAVDAVAGLLEERGITSYLVEIGGEMRLGDPKPDGSPWRVGIEAPRGGERAVDRVLALSNTALATSGDYRNFYLSDGRRFSHLVDPRTGKPVPAAGLGSVSILAPTCQYADAMATALFVLGPSEGPDFAEHRTLDALFLIRQGDEFSAMMTGSFEKRSGDRNKWTGY